MAIDTGVLGNSVVRMTRTLTRRTPVRTPETFSGLTTFFGKIRHSNDRFELVLGDGTAIAITGNWSGFRRKSREVEIEGIATWDAATNTPLSIRVTRAQNARAVDFNTVFKSFALASGSHWDNSDAASHMKRIRGSGV